MKEFSLHERGTSQQHEKPEDILETDANLEVIRRERTFEAEHGFRDMLRLKITIKDILDDEKGIVSTNRAGMLDEIIKNPHTYDAWLGVDSFQGVVTDEVREKYLADYIEKSKKSCTEQIDHTLQFIRDYKVRFDSDEFVFIASMLEDLKSLIPTEKWTEYGKKQAACMGYLRGMREIAELACGNGAEGDTARKLVGLEVIK